MQQNKVVYSVAEVAQILEIGKSTTYELIKRDVIPNIKFGKKIKIPVEAFNNWIRGQYLYKIGG